MENSSKIVITTQEVVLCETQNVTVKGEKMEDLGEGGVIVTSKKGTESTQIQLSYPEIGFHALSKDESYVILRLNIDEQLRVCGMSAGEQIYIFTRFKEAAIELFDNILTACSLCTEDHGDGDNIVYEGMGDEVSFEPDEDSEDIPNHEEMNYKFDNTVEKIFKTVKEKRRFSDTDHRRFEDA